MFLVVVSLDELTVHTEHLKPFRIEIVSKPSVERNASSFQLLSVLASLAVYVVDTQGTQVREPTPDADGLATRVVRKHLCLDSVLGIQLFVVNPIIMTSPVISVFLLVTLFASSSHAVLPILVRVKIGDRKALSAFRAMFVFHALRECDSPIFPTVSYDPCFSRSITRRFPGIFLGAPSPSP